MGHPARPDLYVTCLGPNVLYRNNRDGTFTDVSQQAGVANPSWSTAAAFGDYDGDGWVDLFITGYVEFDLADMPAFGSGVNCKYRGLDVQCGPLGLQGTPDTLYRNNGDGTFTDVSAAAGVSDPQALYGLGAVWSDFNNDGRIDLYVANDVHQRNFLYRNDGEGRFSEVGVLSGVALNADGSEQAGMGITVGDYLNNGRLAIFVTNYSEEYNTLYRNDGDLSFTDVSYSARLAAGSLPYVGWGTGFLDYDNDGWLDLFVANGHVFPQVDTVDFAALCPVCGPLATSYRQKSLLFLNQRDGTFADVSAETGAAIQTPHASRGAAFGDLDNDGDVDIVVADLDGRPMILRNDGGNLHHWINLRLVAAGRNPLALGARVTVVAGGVTQTAEVRSGGSYISQNDLRLHFGLRQANVVERVEIRWPSGTTEVLTNLLPNRFYILKEGCQPE